MAVVHEMRISVWGGTRYEAVSTQVSPARAGLRIAIKERRLSVPTVAKRRGLEVQKSKEKVESRNGEVNKAIGQSSITTALNLTARSLDRGRLGNIGLGSWSQPLCCG